MKNSGEDVSGNEQGPFSRYARLVLFFFFPATASFFFFFSLLFPLSCFFFFPLGFRKFERVFAEEWSWISREGVFMEREAGWVGI